MSRIVFIMTIAVIFVGLAFNSAIAQESITIAGSGGPQAMLRDIAAAFMKAHPNAKVDVPDSIGSGGGIKAAGEGKAELGRTARALNEKEKGYGLIFLQFARSPVVITAHPSIKLKTITAAQSVDVFSGKTTNWKDLGGPDKKIRVLRRHDGEVNLSLLRQYAPGWANLELTERSKMAATDQEMTQLLVENDGAIGFGPLNEAVSKGLTVLKLDGADPMDPGYKIAADFAFVYKPENLKGAVKDFVDFVFSAEGAKLIKKHNAIPVGR